MRLSKVFFKKKGFSLIELLVTITIIALVSGLGLSIVSSVQRSSRDAQRESDLRVLQSALQQYYADQNKYPNGLGNILTAGTAFTNCTGAATPCTVTKTYLNKTPKDPNGGSYFFEAVKSINSTSTVCSISGGAEVNAPCHYYFLCAKLEEPQPASACSRSANHNYLITPL